MRKVIILNKDVTSVPSKKSLNFGPKSVFTLYVDLQSSKWDNKLLGLARDNVGLEKAKARVTTTVWNFANMAMLAMRTCITAAFLTLLAADLAVAQNQTQCDVPGECIGGNSSATPEFPYFIKHQSDDPTTWVRGAETFLRAIL